MAGELTRLLVVPGELAVLYIDAPGRGPPIGAASLRSADSIGLVAADLSAWLCALEEAHRAGAHQGLPALRRRGDPAARQPHRGFAKRQLPMWHAYRVELYPHVGQLSGIRDQHGNELEFPSAFRRSRRSGAPRGIVKIKHGGRP